MYDSVIHRKIFFKTESWFERIFINLHVGELLVSLKRQSSQRSVSNLATVSKITFVRRFTSRRTRGILNDFTRRRLCDRCASWATLPFLSALGMQGILMSYTDELCD